MNTPILTLPLRSKRDVVLSRQYARQIAALLGFDPQEQMWIAAAAFEIAQQNYNRKRPRSIRFQLANRSLEVIPDPGDGRFARRTILRFVPQSTLRLSVPLPEAET